MLAVIKAEAHKAMAEARRAVNQKILLPEPFLLRPIPGAPVETGWEYTPEEIAQNGVAGHGAIDFRAPRGTPVLAAADGRVMASWQEAPVFDSKGKRHITADGQPTWFGAGLFAQIWHGGGRYTQYCHLHELAEGVPFYDPEDYLDRGIEAWDPHPFIRGNVREYSRLPKVKAGDVIGYVGMTGCPVGRPSFPDWASGRPYATMHDDHLHFVVLGRRAPHTRAAHRWDPYGVYSAAEHYPAVQGDWSKPGVKHHSLWLA